jgi:hypothetical protein
MPVPYGSAQSEQVVVWGSAGERRWCATHLLMANVSVSWRKVAVVSNDWMLVPLPNSVIPA